MSEMAATEIDFALKVADEGRGRPFSSSIFYGSELKLSLKLIVVVSIFVCWCGRGGE